MLRFSLIAALAIASSSCDKRLPRTGPKVVPETHSEREDGIRAAFSGQEESDEDPTRHALHGELEAFFTGFGKACMESDAKGITHLISPDAMIQSLIDRKLLTVRDEKQHIAYRAGLSKGLSSYSLAFSQLGFNSFKISRIEKKGPRQVLVYARHWNEGGWYWSRLRWWLFKENGAWKIFDYENLDCGLRATTLMGCMFAEIKEPWIQPVVRLFRKQMELNQSEDGISDLEPEIKTVLTHRLPPEIECAVLLIRVSILLEREEVDEATAVIDRIESLGMDVPATLYLRGSLLMSQELSEEAIKQFEKYASRLGWDSDIHEMVSDCNYLSGNKEAALEHALKGLEDQPGSYSCLASATVASTPGQITDLEARFQAMPEVEDAYEVALDYAIEVEEFDVARALFEIFKKNLPDSELIEYYEDEFAVE